MSMDSLRKDYELLREFEEYVKESGLSHKTLEKIKRRLRREISLLHGDPIAKPITEEWRTFYPKEDSECWSEYAIFKDEGESDEEITDWLSGLRMEIHSMYDCTGKPFTVSLHWSRQPAGIVVVHRLALDV